MYSQLEEQTPVGKKQQTGSHTVPVDKLEFISVPVGTFAGTEERIIRIRNGQRIPADTGDQGGGQN
jgi:hypothetical protein